MSVVYNPICGWYVYHDEPYPIICSGKFVAETYSYDITYFPGKMLHHLYITLPDDIFQIGNLGLREPRDCSDIKNFCADKILKYAADGIIIQREGYTIIDGTSAYCYSLEGRRTGWAPGVFKRMWSKPYT